MRAGERAPTGPSPIVQDDAIERQSDPLSRKVLRSEFESSRFCVRYLLISQTFVFWRRILTLNKLPRLALWDWVRLVHVPPAPNFYFFQTPRCKSCNSNRKIPQIARGFSEVWESKSKEIEHKISQNKTKRSTETVGNLEGGKPWTEGSPQGSEWALEPSKPPRELLVGFGWSWSWFYVQFVLIFDLSRFYDLFMAIFWDFRSGITFTACSLEE